MLCRVQGSECFYQDEAENYETSTADGDAVRHGIEASISGGKRRRLTEELLPRSSSRSAAEFRADDVSDLRSSHRAESVRQQGREDPHNESVFIVGPVVADDAQVIEKFMPPKPTPNQEEVRPKSYPYNVYSNDPRKPVLYTTVSRRRQGVRVGTPPGENQKEILEQVLGPFRDVLVKLYGFPLSNIKPAVCCGLLISQVPG